MKKIIIFTIIFILSYSTGFAVNSKTESAFKGFLTSIESKYSTDQQEAILYTLRKKLEEFKYDKEYKKLLSIIDELSLLTHESLYKIWLKNELSTADQQLIELRIRKSFSPNLIESNLPDFITELLEYDVKFIETNDKREFIESSNIMRVLYSRYFPITTDTVSALKNKSGIVIFDPENGEYRFIETYSFEKKIPYSEMTHLFSDYFTDDYKIKSIAGTYYGYNFSLYNYYDDDYGAYQTQLDASGFSYDTTILYKEKEGLYNFVTKYDSYPLTNEENIFGVPEKHLFLDYLRDDTLYHSTDISGELLKIKDISSQLTSGVSKDQGIKNIYNWVLDNLEYSQNIDLKDEKIFSGIETFYNNQGVCTGYTKLSSYLFYFAGYYDVEVIKGHVIDAQDFPQIGHAWLRIGNLYYDPTFDDPIGAKNTKTPDQYQYFGLPKDIFYANRFEYGDLSEMFSTASKAQIDQHIFNTLSNLIPKYKDSLDEYPVFNQVKFKNTHNIGADTTITPDILASKIGSYNIENDNFKFQKDGNTKTITKIRYYTLNNENTEAVLDILLYNTNKLSLFNWQNNSGNREWRLAYEVEIK